MVVQMDRDRRDSVQMEALLLGTPAHVSRKFAFQACLELGDCIKVANAQKDRVSVRHDWKVPRDHLVIVHGLGKTTREVHWVEAAAEKPAKRAFNNRLEQRFKS